MTQDDEVVNPRGAPGGSAHRAVLDGLLRRMRGNSDFPAMSEQILKVQRIASSENESLNRLATEILKDIALTNKLLRIVNSAQYAHLSDGISTVSRAVSLIGFAEVRNIAVSLFLLDHMKNRAHAEQLKTEFVRALFAATLASDIAGTERDQEQAFIGTLFQSLGRLLGEFYFPDEARLIRSAMVDGGVTEEHASRRVLKLSYEDLGLGVAKDWGLPDTVLRVMRRKEGMPPSRPSVDAIEYLRWVGTAANELADIFLASDDAALPLQLERVSTKYARSLKHDHGQLERLALEARTKLAATVEAMDLHIAPDTPTARLVRKPAPPAEQDEDGLNTFALGARAAEPPVDRRKTQTHPVGPDATEAGDTPVLPVAAMDMLATGVQDITNAMVDRFKLNDVLRMIIETMYRALGFQRVLLCLKDATGDGLVGRLALGHDAQRVSGVFRVPLTEASDLFGAVCLKGIDTHIRDASASNVARRLPGWYLRDVHASSFLLLPLQVDGKTFGLIYADRAEADATGLRDQELALLKTLRNQAVMAFRQSRS